MSESVNATFDQVTASNAQVTEDLAVGGQLDVGNKLSIGGDYVTFGDVPVGSRQGFMLVPSSPPPVEAAREGPVLFFDVTTRKATLRLPASDGGGLVPLH